MDKLQSPYIVGTQLKKGKFGHGGRATIPFYSKYLMAFE